MLKKRLKAIWDMMFYHVPPEYAEDFKRDCLEKNIRRFSVLPFFNIATQIACIFIYLYVYPMAYPDRPAIDADTYLTITIVYCALNILFAVLLIRFRNPDRLNRNATLAKLTVYVYIMVYVILESSQVAIELEVSGNIYRFLATFFVVSFFSVVSRRVRFAYMASYIAISELALYFMQLRGTNVYSYVQINIIVFLICLVATNVYYNSVVRNFELRKRLEFLSMNDELTGQANRRSLKQYLAQSWNTAMRNKKEIGVLMIDIDYFKTYNDTYGHHAGDECLKAVAQAICGCFSRSTDLCARYGGEEFVVVTAPISQDGGRKKAEEVRAAVQALAIPHASNPLAGVVTCSVGVTVERPAVGEQPETLIQHADTALYAAKEAGRNQCKEYTGETK